MIKKIHYPDKYIVWDLETSGLDGTKDKILEIGMFKVEAGQVIDQKRWVLDNNIEIPQFITDINGMNAEIIKAEGKDPRLCIEEFLEHIRECEANLTHNGFKFDIGFLVSQVEQILQWDAERVNNLKKKLEYTSIDTAMIFKGNMHGFKRMWNESQASYYKRVGEAILRGKYNLGVCCDELKIDRSKITQHRALGDVELTHEVFKAMLLIE